jgi:hypothetical protein
MSDPLTYDDLKALAEELNRPLKTLYVLSPQGDPFMAGRESRERDAQWFGALWRRFRFRSGAHIRRVHYVLISQSDSEPVLMPNGERYINSEYCYDLLNSASLNARYLGVIALRDLVDRRNDEARIYYDGEASDPIIEIKGGFNVYAAPSVELPRLRFTTPPKIPQRYMVEIWCEKSTMNDILLPLGRRYGVNVVTGVGEMSLTRCVELVDRARWRANGRPVRILYVSDFDKSGDSMPTAVARKIEFVLRSEHHDIDIQVRPIVLTYEQVEQYDLPRTPAKETDLRAASFARRFGDGVVELDALEALHPGELARILEPEILRYYDGTLGEQIEDIGNDVWRDLNEISDEVRRQHAKAIEELEAEHKKVLVAVKTFEKKAEPILSKIEKDLSDQAPDGGDYDWPNPSDFEGEEDDNPLYDSSRDYVEQVDRYKEHQGKPIKRAFEIEVACWRCGMVFAAKVHNIRYCSRKCLNRAAYLQLKAKMRAEGTRSARRGRPPKPKAPAG